MDDVEKFKRAMDNLGKHLKLIVNVNYSKIELVQNVYVQEDGKIGAELSELELEELDKLNDDHSHNLIVTDEFNTKIICEYYNGSFIKIRTFEEGKHLFLLPELYVFRNLGFYL